ncbi:MAG: hypothetical protein H8E08_00115 [Candidatus Marinimicrobia bacterium]|nr:hypothetical protein [Candidatus Neomarinimicrobiota bacterium]
MNDLAAKNLTPLLIVGQGLSTSVPYAENTNGDYKIIAPGVPRGVNTSEYMEISEEMYLYWLEVYTRAVVQKYAGQVQYWEAENELNAARYTEAFDWWRKGSSWHDDTIGGFLDQVASTLFSVIHDEDRDTETKVVHAFHMFEMARCLDQWSAYYDIAGINFYPNELHAYPVFGFLVGEMVYSARRAIDALGLDKSVWVLETSYSDYCDDQKWNCTDPGSEPVFSGDNLYHWTEERQAQYLQEALETSAIYGAEVFNWFNVVASNSGTVGEGTYSTINNYGGLYNSDINNTPRIAFDTYKDLFNESSDLAWITGESWYNNQEELTSGTFKINNINTGLSSGESIRLYKVPQEITVINQKLPRESVNDSVFHHDWNYDVNTYRIKNSFNPYDEYQRMQKAIYDDRETVSISSNPAFPNFNNFVKLADPWFLDAQNQQPNEFINLEDTNVYSVFLEQDPNQGMQSYKVKAPNLFATVDGIYEFTGWGGTNVNFANSGNRETAVVFESAGATATATYELASDRDYGVVLSAGDELIIPSGADFTCANDFTLYVEGELIIAGTTDEPVSLVTHYFSYSGQSAFIEVKDGGKLYGSGLHITNEPVSYSPPFVKAQPGSIVKISHSTFTTNDIGIMVEDAYVELARCVISPWGTPNSVNTGIDIKFNEFAHNSYSQTNNLYNQVILENCTIRAMDKGIDIDITINGPGYWKGLYVHNSIITENNTGLLGLGYLSSNVELKYVNMSNSTNYDISETIITSHIQTSDPQLDVNHYPTASSPVIDWGDPNSTLDPDGTPIDLGAYYNHQPPASPSSFRIKGLPGNNPRLTWTSYEDDVHLWNVLRKVGNAANFVVIATVSTTLYIDNTVTVTSESKFSDDACYKIEAIDDMGIQSSPTNPVCVAIEGPASKVLIIPEEYALHTAYPNPFNPSTSIRFDLPERSRVSMIIYDVLGRTINTLIQHTMEPGFKEIQWDGKDDKGNPVSTGMYIYRFSALSKESEKQFNKSNKLVLMK